MCDAKDRAPRPHYHRRQTQRFVSVVRVVGGNENEDDGFDGIVSVVGEPEYTILRVHGSEFQEFDFRSCCSLSLVFRDF